MFQKATRKQSKLRLCISGVSGSGKTKGALTLAESIKGDARIAVIDTENGSSSLYANEFDFDVLNLEPPFSPARFVEAMQAAQEAGYGVIVIDSASHEWEGSGGCLEMNELTARSKFKGNTWSAWSDTNVQHQKFINAIIHSKCHVICTARSKTETAQEGKKIVRLGTKLVQRDNFEYEFTVALDLVHDGHFANAIKDRTGIFASLTNQPISSNTGELILDWLNDGKSQSDVLDSYLLDIDSMNTIEELQNLWKAASSDVKAFGDDSKLSKLAAAKDKRKSELEKAA